MVHNTQYLAGVIDSDGSISIIKRLRQTTSRGYAYREVVQITWAYEPLAEAYFNSIKEQYGGSVFTTTKKANEYGKKLPIVKYTAEAKACERLLRDILPHLILKKWQAEYAIQMRELKSNQYGYTKAKPDSVWEVEDRIYKSMQKRRARGNA